MLIVPTHKWKFPLVVPGVGMVVKRSSQPFSVKEKVGRWLIEHQFARPVDGHAPTPELQKKRVASMPRVLQSSSPEEIVESSSDTPENDADENELEEWKQLVVVFLDGLDEEGINQLPESVRNIDAEKISELNAIERPLTWEKVEGCLKPAQIRSLKRFIQVN